MNYGELLAYWYLRLNGFLVVRDYVIHESLDGGTNPSDIDVLGVRFPHVWEPVGGQKDDWDPWLVSAVGSGFLSSPVAVIAEAKTGDWGGITESFSKDRLSIAVSRLGIWPETAGLVEDLASNRSSRHEGWTVMKMAFLKSAFESPLFHTVTLAQAESFIRARIVKYRERKFAHRLFFHDDLMEYLMWSVYRDRS